MELRLNQKQAQIPTHMLIQTMELLQLSAPELMEYIITEVETNPVIDIDCLDGLYRYKEVVDNDDARNYAIDVAVTRESGMTLAEYLRMQIAGMRLSTLEREITEYLVESTDDRGFLDIDEEGLSEELGIERGLAERCLRIVRGLDPIGVCAKNVEDCLVAQLPKGRNSELMSCIIKGCMRELADGHYTVIAESLGADAFEVRRAVEIIRTLNPFPSAGFVNREHISYAMPDAIIHTDNGSFEVEMCNVFSRDIRVSDCYREILRSTDDESVRDYVTDKINAAERLANNIARREGALEHCIRAVIDVQYDYFINGAPAVAMPLEKLAEMTGYSTSTVSRALRNRYIQSRYGTVAVRELIGGGGCGVQNMIVSLIAAEDKSRPLSDNRIVEELKRKGISVSRRAVTKYRERAGIGNTYSRKR